MANIKCNGKIEANDLKLNGSDASIDLKGVKIKPEGDKLNILAKALSVDGTNLLTNFLKVKKQYIDPVSNNGTANTTMASYIVFENLLDNKELIVVWGTTPETTSAGYLYGAPSGEGWVPTSSDGTVHRFFTSPSQYRVIALPYGGTQYSYGWRVVNYLKDNYGGFNIRYGNTTSGIRFSFLMIGFI